MATHGHHAGAKINNTKGGERRMRNLYLVSADCVQFLEHSFEICRFLPIAPHVNVKKPHFHHHANVEKIKAQELLFFA